MRKCFDSAAAFSLIKTMSATKSIISMGLMLLVAGCAEAPSSHHHTAVLQPKPVHSPYIAAADERTRVSRYSYPKPGDFRTYGLVDAAAPIASGPAGSVYAPAEVSP